MDTLIKKLEERDGKTTHKNFYLGKLRYNMDGKGRYVNIGKDAFALTDQSFHQLCELLNVPYVYAQRCPKDLQEDTINSWLELRKDNMWAGLFEGKSIRSFMNPTYSWVPSSKVYKKVISLFDKAEISTYNIDNDAVEFIAFSEQLETNIVNSPVRAGIKVIYSDSWSVFPRFDAYICRTLCLNSAIAPLSQRKFRVSGNSPAEIEEQVEDFARESLAKLPELLKGFASLANHKVDNFISVVSRIAIENRLPRKMRELLLRSADDAEFKRTAPGGKITNMHDVVNLFTYVASHKDLSEEHRVNLFEIAGNIMLFDKERCVACGSADVK